MITCIDFKDSLTGWASIWPGGGNYPACFKTTDCGETWMPIVPQVPEYSGISYSVHYHHATNLLFLSNEFGALVSTDEGTTWTYPGINSFRSCAFSGDSLGIFAGNTGGTANSYTTNGGLTWTALPPSLGSYHPLPIKGTPTFFIMGKEYNVPDELFRTDDGGKTWRGISTPLDVAANDVLYGDLGHLYTHGTSAVYVSTDTGNSWQSLCGPHGDPIPGFFVRDNRIYADDELGLGTRLWYLNLDSVGTFASQTVGQELNASPSQVHHYGDTISAFFTASADSGVGVDTAHFTIHFDSTTLSLQNYVLPYGWVTIGSSSHNGTLDLLLADTADSLVSPSVTVTFSSYLSSSTQSTISLDSVHLTGKWMGCDIATASVTSPDSVQFNFETQCGDSLILASLQNRLPFVVQSIVPNPASTSISISLQSNSSVSYEMFDELGHSVMTGSDIPTMLNVSCIATGQYYLRLSSNGYVQTRTISIER